MTLAPEGGAHQSTITASVGLELPERHVHRAGVRDARWTGCSATRCGRIAAAATPAPSPARRHEDGAYYFRLTTRPLDQAPFEAARARLGRRRAAPAGARRRLPAGGRRAAPATEPARRVVHLVGSGAVLPEVLAAAAELADEGIAAHVVDVTSLDRLYAAWQRTLRQGVRTATAPSRPGALRTAFPDRGADRHRARRRLARDGVARARRSACPACRSGVDQFGQSGTVAELYELHDLLPGSIVNAALAALSLA